MKNVPTEFVPGSYARFFTTSGAGFRARQTSNSCIHEVDYATTVGTLKFAFATENAM